jgi:hypothetical protein
VNWQRGLIYLFLFEKLPLPVDPGIGFCIVCKSWNYLSGLWRSLSESKQFVALLVRLTAANLSKQLVPHAPLGNHPSLFSRER